MSAKTEQTIVYLIKNHPNASVTSLMKLSYLIDLVNVKNTGKQITDFEYRKYNFGPFDKSMYGYLEKLMKNGLISAQSSYTALGDEYITYSVNEDSDDSTKMINSIPKKDCSVINGVIEKVKGYGARLLTDLAYKTKPMLALSEVPKDSNKKLDLSI